MSYTIGSLPRPTLTAMLMQNFSDNLLFIMIASVSFIYLLTSLRKAASSDAGGARLTLQRAAHAARICRNRIGFLPQRGQVVFHENETAGRTHAPHAVAGRHKRITGPGGISTLLCDHTAQGCLLPAPWSLSSADGRRPVCTLRPSLPICVYPAHGRADSIFSTLPISRVNSPRRCAESSSSDQPGTTT